MRILRLPTIRTKHLETVVHTFLTLFTDGGRLRCDSLPLPGPALFHFAALGQEDRCHVQVLTGSCQMGAVLPHSRWGGPLPSRYPCNIVVSQTLQRYYRDTMSARPFTFRTVRLHTAASAQRLHEWNLVPGEYILYLGRFSRRKTATC